jgi:hypothetical protein
VTDWIMTAFVVVATWGTILGFVVLVGHRLMYDEDKGDGLTSPSQWDARRRAARKRSGFGPH